jgi:hypothetical protein
MSVLTFCKTQFRLVTGGNVKVGDLQEEAQRLNRQDNSGLFVVYDKDHRAAAVVIPEAVAWWVERLGVGVEESVADTGLLQALRQGQLSVHQDQPAGRAAQLAERLKAGVVLAVGKQGKPAGLFIPEFVVEVLREAAYIQAPHRQSLKRQVARMKGPGALINVLELIETQYPGFSSEGFGLIQARPYTCDGRPDDGPHTLNHSGPCLDHPKATVSRRGLVNA